MVLSAKIFKLVEDIPMDSIARKLREYREERVYEKMGVKLDLIIEVRDIVASSDRVRAVFCFDKPIFVKQRGKLTPIIRTYESTIVFRYSSGYTTLTVLEKKHRANMIANRISEILFIKRGLITEATFSTENMKRFHEENPESTKVIFFDGVDIPGISKLSLYGDSLKDTTLYTEYLRRGKIWYIVTTSRSYGITVGIARNGVVVAFGNVGEGDFIRFIEDEVLPLIQR
ncbi:MAG: hypothetical protein RMJ00_03820 [Nitrososphaerota archaeon]|nr:hypothetical protein [Candidatus Bathyarchaeota archaeon]MDW8061806.1 hypothetical protein [Nitrososphaerota archaeon]